MGIQLFMFYEQARRDLPAAMRTIAGIGYREVELLVGIADVATIRQALRSSGLRARSLHAPPSPFLPGMPSLSTDLDRICADARSLGLSYVTCTAPWLPPERIKGVAPERIGSLMALLTPADWRNHGDFLKRLAPTVRRAGLTLAYHNHVGEFLGAKGQRGFDILLAGTSPSELVFELDCGWALAAGADPVKELDQHGARIAMIHLKDVAGPTGEQGPTLPLGEGIGNWRTIMTAAAQAGVKAAYVEQDPPIGNPVAAATTSLRTLERLGIAPA